MPTEVAPGIWFHTRAEIGILRGVQLTMGATQEIGRQHYSTGQELGRADLAEWCRQIDAYHRDHNGWLGFGYSFAVGRDADPAKAHIFEGRGWGAFGAHTLNHNDDLGVVFLGNDDPGLNDTTPGVRRALRLLFTTRTGGAIGSSPRALREVHGHRETYSTDCPGDELEAWVKAGLPVDAGPTPTPRPPKPVRPPLVTVPWWWHRTLRVGMTGVDVLACKRRLRRLGYHGVNLTPSFGPAVVRAVERLQAKHHLPVTGVIDRATAHAIRTAQETP